MVSVSSHSHSASQSLLLFHIHHPSGRRGDNAIRLAPAEHVLAPAEHVLAPAEHVPTSGLAPGAESVTDIIYIYTLAQIRPLHCMISSLTWQLVYILCNRAVVF